MIKLIKKQDAEWLGNGLGNSSAEWTVKGAEHIEIWKDSLYWNITNTETENRSMAKYSRNGGYITRGSCS
jgi:hypothetical protein